jgi:hypothetical protein
VTSVPLISADFVNGVYEFNGVAQPLSNLFIQDPTALGGGLTFNASGLISQIASPDTAIGSFPILAPLALEIYSNVVNTNLQWSVTIDFISAAASLGLPDIFTWYSSDTVPTPYALLYGVQPSAGSHTYPVSLILDGVSAGDLGLNAPGVPNTVTVNAGGPPAFAPNGMTNLIVNGVTAIADIPTPDFYPTLFGNPLLVAFTPIIVPASGIPVADALYISGFTFSLIGLQATLPPPIPQPLPCAPCCEVTAPACRFEPDEH